MSRLNETHQDSNKTVVYTHRSLTAFSSARLWSNFRCFLSREADLALSVSSATIRSSS